MKKAICALAAAACLLPAVASAQELFTKPADAIEYRQGSLFVLGQHFTRINRMLKGELPWDPAALKANAALVETVGKLPWDAFGPGTDKGEGTKAKPEIWSNAAKFTEAKERFAKAVPELVAAAATGDKEAVKKAFGAVGGSCKNCHDNFRAK